MVATVKYNINIDKERIAKIFIDVELPLPYLELLVKTSLKFGLESNELILLTLDKFFESENIFK